MGERESVWGGVWGRERVGGGVESVVERVCVGECGRERGRESMGE